MEGRESELTSELSTEMAPTSIDVTSQPRQCLNCDTALTDVYCPHCGQKDIPRRQTLTELCINFISSFWGFESKFFKTCKYLLLKPGFLAIAYNAGQRERYFHPARMYVFTSFIFFLLLMSLPNPEERAVLKITTDETEDIDINNDDGSKPETRLQYDSVQNALPADQRDGWLVRKWHYRQLTLEQEFRADSKTFAGKVVNAFKSHFPQVFFLLLPVFALVLGILYRRKDFFYSEHLVFSICYYNFFFLAGSFAMLANAIPWLRWVSVLLEGSIVLYLLFAMKRFYDQRWGKTILKYGFFLSLFGICILVGLFINLVITLIFI